MFQAQVKGIRGLRELAVLEGLHVMCYYWSVKSMEESWERSWMLRESIWYSSERDGESEIWFPSDLPEFPNSPSLDFLRVCWILLKIVIVLFMLFSGRKQRTTMRIGRLEEHGAASVSRLFHHWCYLPGGLQEASPIVVISSGPPTRLMG